MEEKYPLAWTSVTDDLKAAALFPQRRDELIAHARHVRDRRHQVLLERLADGVEFQANGDVLVRRERDRQRGTKRRGSESRQKQPAGNASFFFHGS